MSERPTAIDRLRSPEAVLTRSDLRDLGWERRAVDAIVRGCPVVALPGYSRPVVLVRDYLELLERSTYRGIECDSSEEGSLDRRSQTSRAGLWRPRFPFPLGTMGCRPGTLPRPRGRVSLGTRGRRPPHGRVAPAPSYPPSSKELMRGRQETCVYGGRPSACKILGMPETLDRLRLRSRSISSAIDDRVAGRDEPKGKNAINPSSAAKEPAPLLRLRYLGPTEFRLAHVVAC